MSGVAELQRRLAFNTCKALARVSVQVVQISMGGLLTFHSYDLPADVFVEGETRPMRKKKTKAIAKTSEATNNKRSFSNTGLDVCDHYMAKTNQIRSSHARDLMSSTDKHSNTGEQ